jgi:outer membrane lipoprotein-sorting protein
MTKKLLPVVFSILLVPAFSGSAAAQTADEITEKVLAALGGRDALGKLTSRRSTGTITVSSPQGDLSGTVEISAKAPNMSRTFVELDLTPAGLPQKMTIDQRFDGTTAMAMDSMNGERDLTPNQIQNARNNMFPVPLLSWKKLGVVVEALPKETVDGKSYLVLRGTPKEGSATKIYIDPETYLPAKTVFKVDLAQIGEVEQTIQFSDYRAVDGVKVPFKTVNTNPGQTATFIFTKVEHNVNLPDSLFKRGQPAVVAAAR